MQPEPTETSIKFSIIPTQTQPSTTSQYGFQRMDLQLPGSLCEQQGGHAAPSSLSSGASTSHDDATSEVFHSLNTHHVCKDHPKPTVYRISEYENALTSLPQKKEVEGPYFKVVKGGGTPNGPQLENFPNEVLTHILSHLPASSLTSVSLVSRRFYDLVTTPHAWRIAFSRFFPCQDMIGHKPSTRTHLSNPEQEARDALRAEQRFFNRLTTPASWRSEYILRTRLLRSLMRGKPAQIALCHGPSRPNNAPNPANPVVTYNSKLFATINHIHAVFSNKEKSPQFIHGADESGSACTSDPSIGKVDNWGLSDPQSSPQFADLFPGDQSYGLGEGLFIGVPNVMDVSQPFGMVYGEGFPGGRTYFRSSDEMRGRFLASSNGSSDPKLGIPKISSASEAICAVWVAKSHNIPSMTDGLIGIITGSSHGIVTAYSLGANSLRDNRLGKGEVAVKWMLSPGVPIIAISVDESYNVMRRATERLFAVALNALGEVYYLTEPPHRVVVERGIKLEEDGIVKIAWVSGRTAFWNLVEPTRRVAREDPYRQAEFDGSYSPRSSSKAMGLSKEQLVAETREIEKFLALRPADFHKSCEGWDMRRKLEVDFAGDDGMGAGENVVVLECGTGPDTQARIKRFTRLKSEQASLSEYPVPKTPLTVMKTTSLFSGGVASRTSRLEATGSLPVHPLNPNSCSSQSTTLIEEWRTSLLSLQEQNRVEITTSAVDMSKLALFTTAEDPLLATNEERITSPFSRPLGQGPISANYIPGYRARFIAVGSNTGTVTVWNMRDPYSSNSAIVNELQPLRKIQTDSPQISCLALSALYIIHGGNDGLVQAWDPLASTVQPLRTINSRFSSRTRRRLVQAEASFQGTGTNLFSAGAIAIDPDPTVLRGMVSLGTHLRYWSYSSTAADKFSSRKRRLRHSAERGSNSAPDKFTNTGRGALMDYIATEQEELKKEKQRKAREEARLRGRFGVGLYGLSEEEALRYAEVISQETYQKDQQRIASSPCYVVNNGDSSSMPDQTPWSSGTVTPEESVTSHARSPKYKTDDKFDDDIEEAIRLSLMDGLDDGGRSPRASGSGECDILIKFKQKKSKRSASSSPSTSQASKSRNRASFGTIGEAVVDDLDFALRLNVAEANIPQEGGAGEKGFPARGYIGDTKGKRRAD